MSAVMQSNQLDKIHLGQHVFIIINVECYFCVICILFVCASNLN